MFQWLGFWRLAYLRFAKSVPEVVYVGDWFWMTLYGWHHLRLTKIGGRNRERGEEREGEAIEVVIEERLWERAKRGGVAWIVFKAGGEGLRERLKQSRSSSLGERLREERERKREGEAHSYDYRWRRWWWGGCWNTSPSQTWEGRKAIVRQGDSRLCMWGWGGGVMKIGIA